MAKVKTQVIKKKKIKELDLPKPPVEEISEIDSADESLDSDQELQLAFKRKQLTPGLNVQMDAPKKYINDEVKYDFLAQSGFNI